MGLEIWIYSLTAVERLTIILEWKGKTIRLYPQLPSYRRRDTQAAFAALCSSLLDGITLGMETPILYRIRDPYLHNKGDEMVAQ